MCGRNWPDCLTPLQLDDSRLQSSISRKIGAPNLREEAEDAVFVLYFNKRSRPRTIASRLRGAQRVKCKVFHLAGVSLESSLLGRMF